MNKPDLKSALRLYIVVFALLFILAPLMQSGDLYLGLIFSQVILILAPALLFWRIHRVEQVSFARLEPLRLHFVPLIVVLSASMWLLSIIYAVIVMTGLTGLGYEPAILFEPPDDIQSLVKLIIVVAIFAGICEEILFRGAIMPAMEQQGRLPAVILSSLLFAFFHGSFIRLPNTFILGVVIAVVVIKTGSLWGGILFHILNNLYSMIYLYLAGQTAPSAEVVDANYWGLLPFFIIALAGAVFSLKRLHKYSLVKPLLSGPKVWLPGGWLSWSFFGGLAIFLVMAFFELAMGFGLLD